MCVADFIRERVRQDLIRILDQLEGRTPSPVFPEFCQVLPPNGVQVLPPNGVDASLVPDRLALLEYYGYDFDKSPITAFLESATGRVNVTSYLDFPTHYHMTLNLGVNGVVLVPSSKRFIFAWGGQDQHSVPIIIMPPPPVRPTYEISIRTWDKEAGTAAWDGSVNVRFSGTLKTSLQITVPGNFKRGEIETSSFVSDDLGSVRFVVVTYNDGADNNAWALDWVEIKNLNTSQSWHCPGNTWLGNQSPLTKTLNCTPQ
jgi:hypothetical protein